MNIRDFYARLLDVPTPWIVKAVAYSEGEETVDVYLACSKTAQFSCPCCKRRFTPCCDSPERTWRHLDTCGRTTLLHARLPVVHCPEHGKNAVNPPWGDWDASGTPAYERSAVREAGEAGDGEGPGGVKRTGPSVRAVRMKALKTPGAAAEEGGPAGPGFSDEDETGPPPVEESAPRQLSLFARNDMTFVNQGIHAFRRFDLAKAVELFRKHRAIYPRGYDVEPRLSAAEFLVEGMGGSPADPCERAAFLCRLWDAFEDRARSEGPAWMKFPGEIRQVFFSRVVDELRDTGPADLSDLPGGIALGFVLLQAGRAEEAIANLQAGIAETPHNAALYGWLGDSYLLRGDPRVARQCYREACLIDPAGIDWKHLQDRELGELERELPFIYDFDEDLARAWLPSHARVEGLFERKVVRLHDGLRDLVDGYLAMEKAWSKEKSPVARAALFFRGLVLCENGESLKYVKKIDLIDVRRSMKEANPDLFSDFLDKIVRTNGATPGH